MATVMAERVGTPSPTEGGERRRPRVVILGGGFGGYTAAKRLKHADVDITLVDRTNHHTFQPLLYQVALATLNPGDIAVPIRWLLRHQKNTEVIMAEATAVDPVHRVVSLDGQADLPYDYLIDRKSVV